MQTLTEYLPLYGKWIREQDKIICSSSLEDDNHGFALFGYDLEDGEIEAEISLGGDILQGGAMIVFRANGHELYYGAGVGVWDDAYELSEGKKFQLTRLVGVGSRSNIEPNRIYHFKIVLEGQKVDVYVDSVKVISYQNLPRQTGTSVGLFCHRRTHASFSNVRVVSARPKAFVAMQFSEPYNEVYRDAVEPLVKEIGFEPLRIDDIYGPGIIINDIINNLSESTIVLAEISEKNANVYYELGLAHAFGKPTLLMATKGTSLPFDVGSHRTICYENTIAGRTKLQTSLRHSLMSLLGRSINN
jgi:hypothetical protein